MRAILDDDRIVRLTIEGGTEIGTPPKGVGLERLRWDGKQLVDLATLPELYVSKDRQGALQIHPGPRKDAQKVKATWGDRKKLWDDGGTITTAVPAKVVDTERLIQEKLREMAIRELEKEGKLEAAK